MSLLILGIVLLLWLAAGWKGYQLARLNWIDDMRLMGAPENNRWTQGDRVFCLIASMMGGPIALAADWTVWKMRQPPGGWSDRPASW